MSSTKSLNAKHTIKLIKSNRDATYAGTVARDALSEDNANDMKESSLTLRVFVVEMQLKGVCVGENHFADRTLAKRQLRFGLKLQKFLILNTVIR